MKNVGLQLFEKTWTGYERSIKKPNLRGRKSPQNVFTTKAYDSILINALISYISKISLRLRIKQQEVLFP